MPRLTADVINDCDQFLNCLGDRELLLSGRKIPEIENLAIARDQFDVLNLSNNQISRVHNIPRFKRLSTLLLANNRISQFDSDLPSFIPNIKTIVLDSNNIDDISIVDHLSGFKKLTRLSLVGNIVSKIPKYRLYTIYHIPTIRVLDSSRVKTKERRAAQRAYSDGELDVKNMVMVKGKRKLEEAEAEQSNKKAKKDKDQDKAPGPQKAKKLSADEVHALKAAIAKATTLEEVTNLESALRAKLDGDINV